MEEEGKRVLMIAREKLFFWPVDNVFFPLDHRLDPGPTANCGLISPHSHDKYTVYHAWAQTSTYIG